MKNMIDICKDFGIEIPAEKQAEFNKAVAENYKTVAEHEKKVNRLTEDLNAEKKRADDAVETLKGFEGKDFEAITKERDDWKKKHDDAIAAYKSEQEEREFNDSLSAAISEAKGRNPKAIAALLDVEKLRSSKNQQADIKSALDSLRTENGYLFEDNGGAARFTTTKSTGTGGATMTREEIMNISDRAERRAAMAKNQHLFTKGE